MVSRAGFLKVDPGISAVCLSGTFKPPLVRPVLVPLIPVPNDIWVYGLASAGRIIGHGKYFIVVGMPIAEINHGSFVVAHTDYLMVSPDRQTVVLYDEHGRFKIVNTQQIRLVEPMNGSASKSG